MGLDIRGYEVVEFVRQKRDEDDEEVGLSNFWMDHACEDRSDGLPEGLYRVSGKITHVACSYSGYSGWKNSLAEMLGTTAKSIWKNPEPCPFVELINYSDCEGYFGPKTCAKLAKDFEDWSERAKVHFSADPFDFQLYEKMKDAFSCASGRGAVHFS